MAEIDDNELQALRTAAAFIKKAEEVDGGAEMIEALAKKINPKIRTSRDIADALADEKLKPVNDELKELRAFRDEVKKNISDYNESEALKRVKSAYGFTDEGMSSLKKFMDEKGVKDPEIAAAYWEKTNPSPAARPSYVGDSYTLSELSGAESTQEESMKLLKESPEKFQDQEIRNFFNEKRQAESRRMFGEQ